MTDSLVFKHPHLSEHMPYNEQELLDKFSEGDEYAFRQLFNIYRGKLYSYILRICQSKEIAEDTVHDVFLKVWINREKLSTVQNLHAYLYRAAHNHAYNGLRRMATEALVMAELREHTATVKDPEDKLIKKEVRQFIHETINNLTPQQKQVFGMSWEEGLKQEEIATKLNISILTVKRHLTDARNFLRKEVSSHYSQGSVAMLVIFFLSGI